MPMIASRFLKFVEFTKTQMEKSRELNINFSSNEKVINSYMNSYFMANIVFWQR